MSEIGKDAAGGVAAVDAAVQESVTRTGIEPVAGRERVRDPVGACDPGHLRGHRHRDEVTPRRARDLTHEPHVGSLHEVRVLRTAPGRRQERSLEVDAHDLPDASQPQQKVK